MIQLDISDYVIPFENLNGPKRMNIRPIDLARAMVSVGRHSWMDVFNLGFYRIGELICKALAFSKINHGNLVLHERFLRLDPSEKATISYYFGQALTKLYAEEFLDVNWLLHVNEYEQDIQCWNNHIAVAKRIIGNTDKIPSRPDLIGIKGTNSAHIFEAKARSNGYQRGIMQHAINQVSQVISYNGVVPLSRSACFFALSLNHIRGTIIDPINDNNGVKIGVNEVNCLRKYYSFFTENSTYFPLTQSIGNTEFLLRPVGAPNIYFGFDKRILEMDFGNLLQNGLYPNGTDFLKNNSNGMQVSLGKDGIVVVEFQA